jgi:hypothetical protein
MAKFRRWIRYIACVRKARNLYVIVADRLEANHLGDLVCKRIYNFSMCTEFSWRRVGSKEELFRTW